MQQTSHQTETTVLLQTKMFFPESESYIQGTKGVATCTNIILNVNFNNRGTDSKQL
jgi:hypothetical protein